MLAGLQLCNVRGRDTRSHNISDGPLPTMENIACVFYVTIATHKTIFNSQVVKEHKLHIKTVTAFD